MLIWLKLTEMSNQLFVYTEVLDKNMLKHHSVWGNICTLSFRVTNDSQKILQSTFSGEMLPKVWWIPYYNVD